MIDPLAVLVDALLQSGGLCGRKATRRGGQGPTPVRPATAAGQAVHVRGGTGELRRREAFEISYDVGKFGHLRGGVPGRYGRRHMWFEHPYV